MSKSQRLAEMEQRRREDFAKADADWKRLTEKDEWPEEEHEQRAEALLRKCLFSKPDKR